MTTKTMLRLSGPMSVWPHGPKAQVSLWHRNRTEPITDVSQLCSRCPRPNARRSLISRIVRAIRNAI